MYCKPTKNDKKLEKGSWQEQKYVVKSTSLKLLQVDGGLALVAQLVEQRTENPRVTGSIPVQGMGVSGGRGPEVLWNLIPRV